MMDNLNPIETVTGILIQGIVLGVVISIAYPISKLIAIGEFKAYEKAKGLIGKPEKVT